MSSRSYNFSRAYHGKSATAERRKIAASFAARAQARARAIAANYAKRSARYVRKAAPGYIKRYGPLVASSLMGAGDYELAKQSGSVDGRYRVGMHGMKEHGSMGSRGGHTPKVYIGEKGEMRICHSEFIGVLVSSGTTGSTNFVSQSYAIQPANTGTLPWGSQIAVNFQSYEFDKCVFEYRPYISESTSTSAATLTSMGSCCMATQYNSVDGPYSTYQQMAESDYAVTFKPSEHALHAIECKPKYNPLGRLYTSPQTSLTVGSNSSDIRMQNLGIFQIASQNIPIASNTALSLGEIWIHYELKLFKPQLNAYLGALQSAHYYGSTACGSPATTTPFGPNVAAAIQPTAVANNLLALTFTTTAFTFPLEITSGNYLCTYYCRGSGATVAYGNPSAANGTILTAWNGGTLNQTQAGVQGTGPQTSLASTSEMSMSFIVQVNAPGASLCTVTLSTTVVPTSGQFDLIVTPYNFSMV